MAADRLGTPTREVRVGMRTGDTPAEVRRAFGKKPPDILVTTPESLYLILTSQAREALRNVHWIIIDEIHALAGTKRGAHLALSLERLEAMTDRAPQRIGLSATQRPLSAVAGYLGGRQVAAGDEAGTTAAGDDRRCGCAQGAGSLGRGPGRGYGSAGGDHPARGSAGGPMAGPEARTSIWPSVYPRVLELVREHRSTIVFTNSRRLSERLALNLNELAGEDIARAHHGSIAREQRLIIEEQLKQGTLPCIVATSSLELVSTWARWTS